jgi:hypothetical protein
MFSASFLIIFLSPHTAISTHTRSFPFITDYDVLFIVRDGSVSFQLLLLLLYDF